MLDLLSDEAKIAKFGSGTGANFSALRGKAESLSGGGRASGLLAALNAIYRTVVTPAVTAAEGRVVKLLGDGALIEISAAAQALRCAFRI